MSQKNAQIASITANLNASEDRATGLSDALAMSKGGVTDQSKEVAALEKKVQWLETSALTTNNDPYAWPALTDPQITNLIVELKPYGMGTITIWSSDSDDQRLVASLKTIVDALKARVVCGIGSPDSDCEIEIGADDRIGPILLTVLEKIGTTKLDKWKGPPSPNFSIAIGGRFSATPPPSNPDKPGGNL